jgi:hypothetical protein
MPNDVPVRASRRPSAAITALALVALFLVPACGSEGKLARDRQESLLDSAMTNDAKVVVLQVFQNTAYVAVTERLLNDLGGVNGVMDSRRGYGEDEAYALVAADYDPQALVIALDRMGYRAKVVRVVTKASLAEEAKK